MIPFLPLTKLDKISIISSTLEVVQPLEHPVFPETSKITALQLEDITVDPSLLQPSFQAFHSWLFASLKSLCLVRSGLAVIDCGYRKTKSLGPACRISPFIPLFHSSTWNLFIWETPTSPPSSLSACSCVSPLPSSNLMSAATISQSSTIHSAFRWWSQSGCSICLAQRSLRLTLCSLHLWKNWI